MRHETILSTIGATPHVRLRRLFPSYANIWIKLERANPGGSIKDRIALSMVDDAEQRGLLKPGGVIIEPTSGNTGVGLAMVAAVRGYKLIVVMPESMSLERRRLVASYGATLVLTPRERGMTGAVERAKELVAQTPGAWMPQQFENPANPRIHEQTTAREILADFPEGIDFLITGVGTGGHKTASAQIRKERFPAIKVFAVEPALSPVLSGGSPAPHPLQGIGAGFVPANFDRAFVDDIIKVEKDEAFEFARRAAREEGMFIGPSSGASLAAVSKSLSRIPASATVLTFCYDTGERYLSVDGLFA
ncbi:MAG: cysteine synthase A [Planctomycetota bacterium]|nr:cysteine synthase A [Planctomycetota bacterium]